MTTESLSTRSQVPINGRLVRAARNKHKWGQTQLASKAGVSRSYVAEIELGVKKPRFLVANALANALGIPLDSLLLGEQDQATKRPA